MDDYKLGSNRRRYTSTLSPEYNIPVDPETKALLSVPTSYTQKANPQKVVEYATNGAVSESSPAKKGILASLFAWLKGDKGIGPNIFSNPEMSFGDAVTALQNKQVLGGPKLSTVANVGSGIYQGANAISNASELGSTSNDLDSIVSDIKALSYTNPYIMSELSPDQLAILRKVKNGSFDNNRTSKVVSNVGKSIPKAALATLLGGLTGGVPGALINGLGTLGNGALEGGVKYNNEKNSELQGLYSALQNADQTRRDRLNSRRAQYIY